MSHHSSRHGAVRDAIVTLETAGHEAADFAARAIMAHVTGDDAGMVMVREDVAFNAADAAVFQNLVQKVASGTPLFRAIGVREFHGLDFALSKDTLEPRDDTEALIEAVLSQSPPAKSRFSDLGTGSGIVAISLLHELSEATAVATDISAGALQTATANAARNGVGERLSTAQGSWCEPLEGAFDFMVSNPPYIASDIVDGLDQSVLDHDPRRALDGGETGLEAYREILSQAGSLLRPGGFLALEIGYDQAEAVTALAQQTGWRRLALYHDLQGHDRALVFAPV
ncbi:peptide chain release factor N(5)-glutamine methyltransferase [Ahrensia sp. R2A130]|uniref:peptide chain release factor N(5)-glutamine methyltransferase n=1 Tax=Ahrensia sp. R2A130 TaxID=744979 RepID=UPI0001E0D89C|nr:peptide chain release factor N(5)-glutamine methyltransferase [Ahrensia sp. R2A130]EFL87945.1 protein-(glutamine-N5) methyltransferase, release factor-specific [Ahrensia sp. R2A130]